MDGPSRSIDGGPAREVTVANVEAFFHAAFNVQRREHALVSQGEAFFKRGYGYAALRSLLHALDAEPILPRSEFLEPVREL